MTLNGDFLAFVLFYGGNASSFFKLPLHGEDMGHGTGDMSPPGLTIHRLMFLNSHK